MINNTNVENKHTTNGVLATVYPITFQGAATDSGTPHLRVMLKAADGTSIRRLVYNVDYELVREEIDPTVPQTESMSVPPVVGIKLLNAEDATAGNSLTITRETPFVQDVDFQVGRIDPEQVEDTADLSVLRDQELSLKTDKINDKADEAIEIAEEAKEIAEGAEEVADEAKEIAENIDGKAQQALDNSVEALETAEEAKELAEDTAETVESFDDRLTQAEQDSSDAKSIAQTTSGNLTTHTSNTNNPHQVTKAQVGLGNVDNTSDLDKPVSTATQNAITPLQQQINHLQTIGRFLSFWDATTGLAQTNPQTSPYIYQTGDYFRVGVVASGGATNYRPTGSSYTTGVASTVVETNPLTEGQVYYYDGINWALAAGGSIATDGTTIVFNSDNEIQAVAVVDQNTGIVKTWTGTAAEYEAIVTKDPDTEYIITDDIGGSATDIGQITEDVNELKAHEVVEFQAPTVSNNYTWYRLYADGWVEQGGSLEYTAGSDTSVVFPITMANTRYTAVAQPWNSGGYPIVIKNKTTTGFDLTGNVGKDGWQVSGMRE